VLIVSTFPSGEERDLPPITYKKTVSAKPYCTADTVILNVII
jgi:hypothetical protein